MSVHHFSSSKKSYWLYRGRSSQWEMVCEQEENIVQDVSFSAVKEDNTQREHGNSGWNRELQSNVGVTTRKVFPWQFQCKFKVDHPSSTLSYWCSARRAAAMFCIQPVNDVWAETIIGRICFKLEEMKLELSGQWGILSAADLTVCINHIQKLTC